MNGRMNEYPNKTHSNKTTTNAYQFNINPAHFIFLDISEVINEKQWDWNLTLSDKLGGCQKQSNEQCLGHLRQANKHHTLQKANGWNLRFSSLFFKGTSSSKPSILGSTCNFFRVQVDFHITRTSCYHHPQMAQVANNFLECDTLNLHECLWKQVTHVSSW